MTGTFLADVRAIARKSTQRGMAKALACLDRRLASIELIGWPALEDSLRKELQEAIAIARARGMHVADPGRKKAAPEPRGRRFMTCGICKTCVHLHGSRSVIHAGVRKHVCAPCAKAVGA